MTLEFYYFRTPAHLTASVISACIFLLANLYIVKSGKNQLKEVRCSKLLVIIGIINMIVAIIDLSTPDLYMYDFSMKELEYYQNYYLLKSVILEIPFLITFGGFITILGIKNRERFEIYLMNSGILMIFTYIAHICCVISYFTYLITQELFRSPIWYYYLIVMNIGITTYALALGFLIIHGKRNNDRYILYAVVLMIIRNFGESPLQWFLSFLFGFY